MILVIAIAGFLAAAGIFTTIEREMDRREQACKAQGTEECGR